MGCTQSKSTDNVVIASEKNQKVGDDCITNDNVSKAAEEYEVEPTTTSRTAGTDDHDCLATTISTSTTQDTVPGAATKEIGVSTMTSPTSHATKSSSAENRTPSRRRRTRSNSTGVEDMSLADVVSEEVKQQHQEQQASESASSFLQPVKPPKQTSTPASSSPGEKPVNLEPRIDTTMEEDHALNLLVDKELKAEEEAEAAKEKGPLAIKEDKKEEENNDETKKKIICCAGCNAKETDPGEFKFCAKCKAVNYCSRGCQKAHWKEHKKVCSKDPVATNNVTGEESSWSISNSSSNASSTENTNDDSDHAREKEKQSSIHDEAVKELEDCLARLRSADPEIDDNDREKANASEEMVEKDKKVSHIGNKATDPVETAREESNSASSTSSTASPTVIAKGGAVSDENVAPSIDTTTRSKQQPRKCEGCHKEEKVAGAFKSCAKCQAVNYCNRQCQKNHWKEHKKTCCKIDSKKQKPAVKKDASLTTIQT